MIVTKFLPMIFSLFAFNLMAGETPLADAHALEPCINGEVSASGTFPSQAMEEQIDAYMRWSNLTGQPYYLFTVANDRLVGALDER
jgi:hypothetical protein